MSSPCEQGDDNPSALPSDIIDKTRFCQIASLRTAGFTRGNTTASQGMKPILLTRQRSNVFELIKENSAKGFLILSLVHCIMYGNSILGTCYFFITSAKFSCLSLFSSAFRKQGVINNVGTYCSICK